MEKSLLKLDKGTTCTSWNYSGDRLASGSVDGTLAVFDLRHPASSSFACTSRTKVDEGSIVKIVWVPPEYGDAVACVCEDGTFSLWEELTEDSLPVQWKLCERFKSSSAKVLDVQFGVSPSSLKMAEFQNVIDLVSPSSKTLCLSASISWNPLRGEGQGSSFVLGFSSDSPQLTSSKVWEFDRAHQRWLPVAEMALPDDRGDQVHGVAWAPNIGRPYEVIAVATEKGISIWHLSLNVEVDGRLSVEKVASLSGHEGEVWQMEWDMSGMTLATTASDGTVKLWQSNLKGSWQEQATFVPT
ncbi:protein SEH1 isoform X2 [Rhodamnia argentea]|uniref:Protein SEH1 isoform X2 n=1 Tax=Rhodamnia argentea TaxID=178133 RepID=A0ABM3HYJ1_9MYRT|nr:protein SEH1 isoform X2 [Rhodamnia argentea]